MQQPNPFTFNPIHEQTINAIQRVLEEQAPEVDDSNDTHPDEPKDNKRALPPPVESPRPGPSDWMNRRGAVCDGDYITLRNNAWSGVTVEHSWNSSQLLAGGTLVYGVRKRNESSHSGGPAPLSLSRTRMDNEYSYCVRRIEFNKDKKAWVLPSWKEWVDRKPLNMSDHVIFLCPNDPDLALGTRNPGNAYANNGDYRVELVHFPIVTAADVTGRTITSIARRAISMGFWRADKKNLDFINQSRCVWSFHPTGAGTSSGPVLYGSSPINIRNMWTEVKAQETRIWEGLFSHISLVGTAINKNFHGGRNLTQASGSDGRVVKLALHNKDSDDKAGWIIDGWHGNRYPVQRAMKPSETPPVDPDIGEKEDVEQGIVVPDLTDQIQNPPPSNDDLTLDKDTGTNVHTGLEHKLQGQNPDTWIDIIAKIFFGKKWGQLDYIQQLTIIGVGALGGIIIFDDLVKETLEKL